MEDDVRSLCQKYPDLLLSISNLLVKRRGNDRNSYGGESAVTPGCFKCGEEGHYSRECPKMKCYNCNENGHSSRNCPKENVNGYQRNDRGRGNPTSGGDSADTSGCFKC